MLWTLKLLEDYKTAILDVMRAKRTAAGQTPDDGPGSDLDVDSDTFAAIQMAMARYIRIATQMIFAPTASGEGTKGWTYFFGVPDGAGGYGPVKARSSSGTAALEVTATGATGDLQDEELTDEAERVYKIAESYSFSGAGTVALDVESITKGIGANLPIGSALTFSATPANVEDAATIVVTLEGGVSDELDPSANARVLDRTQNPSLSGNNVHWRRWVEETDAGVFDGWVWPKRYGDGVQGTVDYAATLRGERGSARIISAAQTAAITAHINESAPVQQMQQARQLTVVPQELTAQALLALHPAAAADKLSDWDSATLDAGVITWSSITYAITADKDIHNDLVSGMKAIINSAQAVVDAVGTAGGLASNAMFTVTTDFRSESAEVNPHPWPALYDPVGATVTAGGGTILAAHTKLIAYFNGLGPCLGDHAADDRADWVDTYQYKFAQAEIRSADEAIYDVTLTSEADTTPTDPLDSTIPMLILGEAIIHEDKS
jgi:uncharacterized phage protein gp47/JayE